MQRITPALMASGKYVLKTPYVLNPTMEYQCIALRDFVDCYRKGEDVQALYYTPFNLIDGANGFSFDAEVAFNVKIVTLKGKDGSLVYVPDSYIQSYPTQSETKYKQVILACSLGVLPDSVDLSELVEEIQGMVVGITGVEVDVIISSVPLLNSPTEDEHEQLEAIRLGHITITESSKQQIDRLNAKVEELNQTIQLMSQQLT